MSNLSQALRNLSAAVDFECERGSSGNRVEVDFDDLNAIVSWIQDIKDNDHVDAASFFRER